MPKNIVIFSDGTGQAGGINFDEARTNVYKLFRACRVGPDTCIDPGDQVAFYDPGLGSAADGGRLKIGWMRTIYNGLSMATGLGITKNIIDCYAAIIRLYEDGDRVFLIGFSRGAYTVRSLAGVLKFCGIPRHLPGGEPLPLDPKGATRLAEHAVKDVYQFCSSYKKGETTAYRRFMMDTRSAIAAQFRADRGSADGDKANVVPYFIGVFDTVAALGHKWLSAVVVFGLLAALAGLLLLGTWLSPAHPWWGGLATVSGWLIVAAAVVLYLKNYLKMAPALPGQSWVRRLATIHFTRPKHKFYDTTLDPNVVYAKHAISIDENRADFARVPWAPTAEKAGKRDEHGNIYFEQVWFPGVHADIGGGYIENEARLSDIAMGWMLAAASIIPDGLKHDSRVLTLRPDPCGPQHDEQAGGWLPKGLRALPTDGEVSRTTMHRSVYRRFTCGPVVLFDHRGPYLPPNVAVHVDFRDCFRPQGGQPAQTPACMADDIEAKWAKAGFPGKLPVVAQTLAPEPVAPVTSQRQPDQSAG
ncbi:DUF2235 domain-containing protein [Rhodopseudomonas palustris]|uniref:DUF2235 domain-containing protein n=1 Tax=Rhodopseudomonas palustris TaxID=1076 RepID=UPI0021F2C0D7|nr:DUF2235 domain-containing protein [Rhodopseudomonas palustris]UYO55178.1 DUF2235 domain-containing protein [Rhodopseudomonas palustris]